MPAPMPPLSPSAESALSALGELLKQARLKRRMSQEMLGQRCGVGRRVIAKLESSPASVPAGVFVEVLSVLDPEMLDNVVKAVAHDPIGDTLARQRMPTRAVQPRDDF
ncbi:helix-turn-helix domain-containing protein [Stenotrophomonas sp. JC08]|uniref:helix-turn-helix domain-containing protein n=1 Tax=Stenotrophomonas sp. JC08 TaxID=3445779 RepID=UPI003FA1CD55